MSQITFSDVEYGNRKRTTKREEFLDIMEEIIPWEEWVEYVRPHYIEYRKSAIRCKVEHAFKIIKDTFGFRKVRYKGIAKTPTNRGLKSKLCKRE